MKSRRFVITASVVLLTIGAAVWWSSAQSTRTAGELNYSAAESSDRRPTTHLVTIGDQSYTAELAATAEEQALGLAKRDDIDENSGMLFPFIPAETVSFWMKDMRFNLDIVWIANGTVVGIEKNVPAPNSGTATQDLPTYQPPQPVDYVLELKAGQSQFFQVGEEVTITKIQST